MNIWIYILSGTVTSSLFYVLVTYSSLFRLSNKVKDAFAAMDVYLKKRWDLIPCVIKTVNGYAKHERDTLDDIIRIRSGIYDMMSPNDKIYTNEKLRTDISKIMMAAERYPDLKANQNYLDLCTKLSIIENEIANTREHYNEAAKVINLKIQIFPNSLVAALFRFKERRMFNIFIFLFSFILFSCEENSDYSLTKYHVDMIVNENNTFNITEQISAQFNVDKHGIIRAIPLQNNVVRLDGTESHNRAKITNISIKGDLFEENISGGMKELKIGDPDKYITGNKDYEISYLYDIGNDPLNDCDELYFNLI